MIERLALALLADYLIACCYVASVLREAADRVDPCVGGVAS